MKTKKMLSLIMAVAMMFSLAVSSFAAATPTPTASPNEFTTTATVAVPDIDVTVPASAPLFINPMGFQVKISDGSAASGDEEAYQITKNQIVSPVFQIANASPMKLKVLVAGYAVATSATGTSLKVIYPATEAADSVNVGDFVFTTTGDSIPNEVYIYVTFDKVSGEGEEATMKDATYTYVPEANTATPTKTQSTYGLVKPGSGNKLPSISTLVGEIPAGADGEASVLGFKFQGACNDKATKDYSAGWAVDIKMAFTFKPVA